MYVSSVDHVSSIIDHSRNHKKAFKKSWVCDTRSRPFSVSQLSTRSGQPNFSILYVERRSSPPGSPRTPSGVSAGASVHLTAAFVERIRCSRKQHTGPHIFTHQTKPDGHDSQHPLTKAALFFVSEIAVVAPSSSIRGGCLFGVQFRTLSA